MTDREAPLREALGRVAAGAPLDDALSAIASAAATRFGADACRVWLVKSGDICSRCELASACENRDMCLHLKAATDGAGSERVPLVVFRDRTTARGGGGRLSDGSSAATLLFGGDAARLPADGGFAALPLKGPAGVLGVLGLTSATPVPIADLDALRSYADAAILAIRIADLTSRCQRAGLKLDEAVGERAEVGGLLHAILVGSAEHCVVAEDLDGRITVFSEGARTTYGYAPEDVIGRVRADVLFAPEEIASGRAADIFGAAAETGRAEAVVTRLRKNGERFSARATFTLRRDEEGDPCGFVVVERDLSADQTSARLSETASLRLALADDHLADARSALATVEGEAAALREENASLRAASADRVASEGEIERLTGIARDADARRAADTVKSTARIAELTSRLGELTSRLAGVKAEAARSEAVLRDLGERVEAYELVNRELREQFANLRGIRAELETSAKASAAREADLTARLEDATVRLRDLELHLDEEAEARGKLERANEALTAGRDDRDRRLAAVTKERDAMDERTLEWETERVLLVAERERLLAHRDRRIAELESVLAAVDTHAAERIARERDAALARLGEVEARAEALEAGERGRHEARSEWDARRTSLEARVESASNEAARARELASLRESELAELRDAIAGVERERRAREAAAEAVNARLRGEVAALRERQTAHAGSSRVASSAPVGAAGAAELRLLADLSHELRSPMNAIIGYTRLLLDDAGALAAHQAATLGKVERNARDLLRLINNVLDLSKIEAGRLETCAEAIDLLELASDVRATVEPSIGVRPLKILLEIPAEAATIYSDRSRLQQILVNLLTNAVNFTPFGKVSVRAAVRENTIEIAVADTGVGIAEQHMGTIFEEYAQVGRPGGTGLGLPISRRLARLLGGDLTATSRPGWGSTFTLTLPRALEPKPAASADRGEIESGALLVFAADPNEAYLVAKYLREGGRRAVVAEDAARARELASGVRAFAAVVDVASDGGWSILEELSAAGTPVVAIGPASDRGRLLERGAKAFVTRPVERLELLRSVERAASGVRPRLLVIDDEDDAREVMAGTLASGDFEVDVASDGASALEHLSVRRPDLIVLDLMMPSMDGFEIVHQLNSRPEWRDIPVLLVSAKDLDAEERRALGPGVRRVIRKGDLDREQIYAEIDRAVSAS